MKRHISSLLITAVFCIVSAHTFAQETNTHKSYLTKSCIYEGDTIPHITIRTVYIYPKLQFSTRNEALEYYRLVRNVKQVLPIATMINNLIIETYEYLETLPTKREKKRHMKAVEEGLKEQFTAEMKKLTYSQGQLLIKLIARQSNQSSFQIVKAFMGPFKANFYQIFAKTFGSTLKVEYDPKGKDRLTERVVILVQNGQL